MFLIHDTKIMFRSIFSNDEDEWNFLCKVFTLFTFRWKNFFRCKNWSWTDATIDDLIVYLFCDFVKKKKNVLKWLSMILTTFSLNLSKKIGLNFSEHSFSQINFIFFFKSKKKKNMNQCQRIEKSSISKLNSCDKFINLQMKLCESKW